MSSNPIPQVRKRLRPEWSDGREALEKAIRGVFEQLERTDVYASCVTCRHFMQEQELCSLGKPTPMRPPANVIANGCRAYDDVTDIPF